RPGMPTAEAPMPTLRRPPGCLSLQAPQSWLKLGQGPRSSFKIGAGRTPEARADKPHGGPGMGDDKTEKKFKEGIAYGLWAGWLFGFAGLHRLYLGKWGTGFLWLFTWGLLGVGQLVDLITLRRQVDEANLLEEARAMRSASGQHRPSPEQLILRAAMKEGGKLTVTQAAMITGWSFQE
ncbi:MAG: TM2 domain-containing protein, partial [Gemmatimonadetes bacterium]|nr:TM2 domain-containing protein [Gemmatimonadota bacterium]NIS01359.1 TM2 domain-containing protein [Gemmatimonadota bacterium]NIT67093.1 TM2 domain-containing protein [Gemmatimonadota bacterium]NIU51929.1 NINE protein [Gemmatimonadota bacterium]NIV23885.1 NINE protein [Gemmatimonadota bacterium]